MSLVFALYAAVIAAAGIHTTRVIDQLADRTNFGEAAADPAWTLGAVSAAVIRAEGGARRCSFGRSYSTINLPFFAFSDNPFKL